jgi:hypothetical protein
MLPIIKQPYIYAALEEEREKKTKGKG